MATDQEKARIEKVAKRLKMSVAELLRTAVNEFVEQEEKTKKGKKSR